MPKFLLVVAALALTTSPGMARADLSPETWDAETRARLFDLNGIFGNDKDVAIGRQYAIASTTSPPAIYAGLMALEEGGTAADAAVTTALTQIALAAGSWVSYAGFWTMVYYDAETGKTYSLNAAYDTVRGETEPLTIPKTTSGRTVLVPGFMAGAEAAHERFGKLPWATLFEPAIYVAENGVILHSLHQSALNQRKDVLSRFPETKAIFTKPDGTFYGEGDLFKQPALAETLHKVAREGAAYMYEGEWAEKLVKAVQAAGGKLSMEDMTSYEPLWARPMVIDYNGYEIHAPALPALGGMQLAETLYLAEEAGLAEMGRYTESAETLFWLTRFTDQMILSFLPPATTDSLFPATDLSHAARATRAHARDFWSRMKKGELPYFTAPEPEDPRHSDAIVVVDGHGNVAAVVHTINTVFWGSTGIFVDGISIPDSASFQQQKMAAAGPGKRLPDITEPLLILNDGEALAAVSSIGSGLHQKTTTVLLNLLEYGRGINDSVNSVSFHLPEFEEDGSRTQVVYEGEFRKDVIDDARAMGLAITVKENGMATRGNRGYVVGVTIDEDTGELRAVAPQMFNGLARAN